MRARLLFALLLTACGSRAHGAGDAGAIDLAVADLTVATCMESLQAWCDRTGNCIADLSTALVPGNWPQQCPMFLHESSCGAFVVITESLADYDVRFVYDANRGYDASSGTLVAVLEDLNAANGGPPLCLAGPAGFMLPVCTSDVPLC